ncbi:MAG TPA: ABC transporter permease, partial [Ktedonobacter sp.]|nr:ABC transporter permease [Ktedonobacter sp.]
MFWSNLLFPFTTSDLWAATLQFSALLLLPALGGVISERSGVVNIAMEGMTLTGAYAGIMVGLWTHSLILGIIGAMIAGGLMALIHAIVSINFKADQVISGIAINIAALGLTDYLLGVQTNGGVPSLSGNLAYLRLPYINLGPLSNIPFIGPVFFRQNIIFYVAILILIGIQFLLFRTNIGLRIRAVGEHPQAADT